MRFFDQIDHVFYANFVYELFCFFLFFRCVNNVISLWFQLSIKLKTNIEISFIIQ